MSDEIRNGDDEVFDDASTPEEEPQVEEPAEEQSTGSADPPPAGSGAGGVGRRDVVKALATVPVLGALGFTALRRRGLEADERKRLLAELGIEDDTGAQLSELERRTYANTIRIGIVGYGGEGESLVRSLGFAHPDWIQARREAKLEDPRDTWLDEWLDQEDLNVEVTAVCDVFDVRAERAIAASTQPIRPGDDTRQLKPARRYRHFEELVAAPDVDAVIIATPDHWHSRITVAAARMGKHVYCEKCMTRTEEEVWPMADAVRSNGIVFQLGHQNRQMESHARARDVIARGILGPIEPERPLGRLGVGHPRGRQPAHDRLGAVPGSGGQPGTVQPGALLPLALLVRLRHRVVGGSSVARVRRDQPDPRPRNPALGVGLGRHLLLQGRARRA
jgi:hypothetical protein